VTESLPSLYPINNVEGWIQFVWFTNLYVLHMYVPNNSMKSESLERHCNFDLDMQHLLVGREAILKKALDAHQPILWVGNLKVAQMYLDGTDYSVNSSDGSVKEYWMRPSVWARVLTLP
jgi:exonuclease III